MEYTFAGHLFTYHLPFSYLLGDSQMILYIHIAFWLSYRLASDIDLQFHISFAFLSMTPEVSRYSIHRYVDLVPNRKTPEPPPQVISVVIHIQEAVIQLMTLLSNMELHRLTATGALHKIRANELIVEDYAKSLLKRIERRDSIVKAWAYLDPVQVLNEARRLDRIPVNRRGPLHGLPVGVKDVIYTKGMCIYTPRCTGIK